MAPRDQSSRDAGYLFAIYCGDRGRVLVKDAALDAVARSMSFGDRWLEEAVERYLVVLALCERMEAADRRLGSLTEAALSLAGVI